MALAEQKSCGTKKTDSCALPHAGSRGLSDRSYEPPQARREIMLLSLEEIIVAKSGFIRIGHIDRNSIRLLPRMENRTGKARSRRKRLVSLAALNSQRFTACTPVLALPKPSCAIWSRPQRKAPVAQLDRATVYGTVGWRFEPVRVQ